LQAVILKSKIDQLDGQMLAGTTERNHVHNASADYSPPTG